MTNGGGKNVEAPDGENNQDREPADSPVAEAENAKVGASELTTMVTKGDDETAALPISPKVVLKTALPTTETASSSPIAVPSATVEPALAKTDVQAVPAQTEPQPIPVLSTSIQYEKPGLVRAAYEHPFVVRLTHWINAVSLFVMITSGLRIFRAFPSFGPKIPEQVLIDIPKQLTLGGWLGGALQWHFTFMWFFAGSGILYLAYQVLSGHYRTVLFMPKDIPGVWPMARHYFLFGPKPPATGQYNPLQKLAYTSTIGFGVLSLVTGVVLYKPAQFSWLAFLLGGFHLTRIWHFAAMCGFVAFIPGHLIMVALHGWSNFFSMLSGWKREPKYQHLESGPT